MDQSQAPYAEALSVIAAADRLPLHVPGHKRGRRAPALAGRLFGDALGHDLTELPGLSDLSSPDGPLAHAQRLAAAAYGVADTHFLTGGSTAGVLAMLLAAGNGRPVIAPRSAHRSVVAGMVLAGAYPVFLPVETSGGLARPPAAAAYLNAMDRFPAAIPCVTHPTYHGLGTELGSIVRAAHARGIPVLVDEAHGAHFPFHPGLPQSGVAAGADLVAHSAHKTLGALTGGAWLHRQGNLVSAEALRAAVALLQSTSPSHLILASLDLARREAVCEGRQRLDELLAALAEARGALARAGWHCPAAADPTKLFLATGAGPDVGRELTAKGIYLELADTSGCLAVLTLADDRQTVESLTGTLLGLDAPGVPPRPSPWDELLLSVDNQALWPRAAAFAAQELVSLESAGGRVAAEIVAPCPPGLCVTVPGARLDAAAIACLRAAGRQSVRVVA